MSHLEKKSYPIPESKPSSPCFGSGPCKKRPDWSFDGLKGALLGRSHRSKEALDKFERLFSLIRTTLSLPEDYKIGLTPGSDTGAVELIMWNMIGARGVDVFTWDYFGERWYEDLKNQLKIDDLRHEKGVDGRLPDLTKADPDRDLVFAWNGTTSGIMIPDDSALPPLGEGLRICDATSAIYGMKLPFEALDVVTWSWQKAIGGEGQHGIVILSPRAIERLESYTPSWPIPSLFSLKDGNNKLDHRFFEGHVINTPSMLVVEDAIDTLQWISDIGGQEETIKRCQKNFATLKSWVDEIPWIEFQSDDATIQSHSSPCFKINREFSGSDKEHNEFITSFLECLSAHEVAYDMKPHRSASFDIRIWSGPTVEASDLALLTKWMEWAFHETLRG